MPMDPNTDRKTEQKTPHNASAEPLHPAQTDRRYYLFLMFYLVLLSALGSFVNDMYTPSLR